MASNPERLPTKERDTGFLAEIARLIGGFALLEIGAGVFRGFFRRK